MVNEKTDCLLCGADPDKQSVVCERVYGGTEKQKFWRCSSCDAIYLYPITSDEEDEIFYEKEFDKWMVKRSGEETWTDPAIQFVKMQARELPLRFPWIKRYVKAGQHVLEIGSSSGFTLDAVRGLGCQCTGVEINEEYTEYARSLGVKTYNTLDELSPSSFHSFHLVLHYYVLEHVSKPLPFLETCLEYLKLGGKMIFEVPNADDPLISLYKIPAFHNFYWWRAHHWYFTRRSLGYLLEKLGRPYEIHPGQRYDLSNHIHWMLTGEPGGMGKYSNIFSRETEQSYVEDLKKSWHCDYMIAIVS